MEVMATIGNAILSSFVEGLLDKLTSIMDLCKYSIEEKLIKEIENWKKQLKKIYAELDYADRKQLENRQVMMWVSNLRDLAYDVEDVLDDLATEAQRRKVEAEAETDARSSKLRRIIKTVQFSAEMVSLVESITAKFQEIFKDKDDLHLGGTSQVRERLPTTSTLEVTEARIYGRDYDREKIMEVMKAEESNVNVSVIPIIGMGGVGKTTLAQLIYNDPSLEFDFKAWVSVGEDFDVLKITKTILQATLPRYKPYNGLNGYQMQLKKKLQCKKCLIVLDDVWNKSYDRWTLFCGPLQECARGSRILVTTRDQSVSLMTGTISTYPLKELSQDDCLSVFAQHALGVVNFDNHLHLKDIGQRIVTRCRGLPLAAKALGGLLRGRPNHADWEKVLNSKMWDLPEECNILPALMLSYFHLPFHLKQCFAYCATFPKDFEFDRNELVLLWMAEGFVNQPQNMLELGCQYFDELLSRSFFQVSSNNKSQYMMHDLIHDLAQFISRETCFHLGDSLNTDLHAKIRHSSFISGDYDTWQKFKDLSEMKKLRTFLALPIMAGHRDNYITSKVLHDMVPKLRSLRVLSLAGSHIAELPSSIGALKRLRYLNLSYTNIERLPESLMDLLNLQTLRLRGCSKLRELPMGIGNLINLQCLDISGYYIYGGRGLPRLPLGIRKLTNLQYLDVCDINQLQEMPPQIGNLRNLNPATKFTVGKDNGLKLTELKKLCKLQGKISIRELQNVVDIREAEFAELKEKDDIEELELEWEWRGSSINPSDEVEVLSSLRPHENLSILSIKGFGGSELPLWIGDPTFNKMVKLCLWRCTNIMSLPPLGQIPSLIELRICGMERLKAMGVEVFGDGRSCFASLETLSFEHMEEWEQWMFNSNDLNEKAEADAVRFPKLRDLRLYDCPKLVGKLPIYLPSLQKLCIERCQGALLRSISDFASLTCLEIKNISGLVSLEEALIEDLVTLKDLKIIYCHGLMYLWKDGTNSDKLASLKLLHIENCGQLVSLIDGEEGELPCNLQVLKIDRCNNLEKLANGLHKLTRLRDLKIDGCRKLKSFPARGVPYGLKSLEILRCSSLECVPDGIIITDGNQMHSQLEKLIIEDCRSLTSSPKGPFPNSLKTLNIRYWPTQLFESLCTTLSASPYGFSHLTELKISVCPQLESFPEVGFSFQTLTSLTISGCKNLRSLPNQMHNLTSLALGFSPCPESLPPNLSSLQSLHIYHCENFRSLPNGMRNLTSLRSLDTSHCGCLESFQEGDLPPNLTHLYIRECKNLKQPMSEWGLHRLTSLTLLQIYGPIPSLDMFDSFPDNEGLLLPTSLTSLSISNIENLKFISRGILNLTSLSFFFISSCPNLQSFPTEGFPPTLGHLCIILCPIVSGWCRKHRHNHESIISHIPLVKIDKTDY